MTYRLSLLDKSPIAEGETAHTALRRTLTLAQRAEQLGFHRFWVAEHHNTKDLASSSPEVLLAALAVATQSIRIGSGGVMLQHYSPYKVAENFNLLGALAPGRVDVGVGKAPGGLPLSTRALQSGLAPERRRDFADLLAELTDHLNRPGLAVEGLSATPLPTESGEKFLLGASVDSAVLAAKLGWNFVFARHLNGDDVVLSSAISSFRDVAQRPPVLALAAIIDADADKARQQAAAFTPFRVTIPNGQSVTVGSEAQAAEYARQAGVSDFTVEKRASSALAGNGHDIVAALGTLSDRYGIEEFIIDIGNAGDSRLRAIELLAAARDAATPTALSA